MPTRVLGISAFRCVMRTNMVALVLENFILLKAEQDASLQDESRRKEVVLD